MLDLQYRQQKLKLNQISCRKQLKQTQLVAGNIIITCGY